MNKQNILIGAMAIAIAALGVITSAELHPAARSRSAEQLSQQTDQETEQPDGRPREPA